MNLKARSPFGKVLPTLIICVIFAQVSGSQTISNEASKPQSKTRSQSGFSTETEVVKNQLIVKYKDSVTRCVHCLLKGHQKFSSWTTDHSSSLDEFNSRYEVMSAQPVFRTDAEESQTGDNSLQALKAFDLQKFNNIKARFASRSRRADIEHQTELHHIYILNLPPHVDAAAAAQQLNRDPHVEYAQLNLLFDASEAPNDPYFHSEGSFGQRYDDLWALKAGKLNVLDAWSITKGQGIVVGVIDTGVDYRHKDLDKNMWTNANEIPGNNLDDDANGFVDDVRGWDFTNCSVFEEGRCVSSKDEDNDPMDEHFHGTHVSGTIAAIADNHFGIVGVAPRAQILPVRALNRKGQGTSADLAAALVYAASNGADVLNNSWGCGFCPVNSVIEDAIRKVQELGCVVVFAAGNSSRDVRFLSPQNLRKPKLIVAAASDENDQPTFFTNFGTGIDVAAPGGGSKAIVSNILSTKLESCSCKRKNIVGDKFLRLAGTSMSAPHVSGIAALVLSHRPETTAEEVRQIIRASADDIEDAGFNFLSGTGRVNAARALKIQSTVQVEIEEPEDASASTPGKVMIKGTIQGARLSHFDLFYKNQGDQQQWTPIVKDQRGQAKHASLASWSTAGLPLGWKSLRLVATTTDGENYEDVISVGTQLKAKKVLTERGSVHTPDVSGNLIVFGDLDRKTFLTDLYLFDRNKNKVQRITTSSFGDIWPRISGNVVTWGCAAGREEDGLYYCVYNPATGACPVHKISNADTGTPPAANDRYLAWAEFVGRYWHLVLYDIKTKKKHTLVDDGVTGDMDISGDFLVYDSSRDGLHYYNLKTKKDQRLTNHNLPIGGSAFRLSAHRIAYVRRHDTPFSRFDLFIYDLDKGEERLVLQEFRSGFSAGEFDFSGDFIVWEESRTEIRTLNLKTGRIQPIAIAPIVHDDMAVLRITPAISGRTVVWVRLDALLGLEAGPPVAEINYATLPK